MRTSQQNALKKKIEHEIQSLPLEYASQVLKIVRIYRESVELKSAKKSFREGWKEAMSGKTFPLKTLREDIR